MKSTSKETEVKLLAIDTGVVQVKEQPNKIDLKDLDSMRLLAITTNDHLTKNIILNALGESEILAHNRLVESGFNPNKRDLRSFASDKYGEIAACNLEPGMRIVDPTGCTDKEITIEFSAYNYGGTSEIKDDFVTFSCELGSNDIPADTKIKVL